MARDIFLKLAGIDGESEDATYKGQIELEAVHWSASNTGYRASGGGQSTGKAAVDSITVELYSCVATASMFAQLLSGKPIPTAEIIFRKAAGGKQLDFLKYKLSDVLVVGSTFNAGPGKSSVGSVPLETFTLHFVKFEVECFSQNSKGEKDKTARAMWDIRKNG